MSDEPRWKLGVSACLAGQPVRFDGGHRRDDFVSQVLARHFELVPVCPEMLLGLGAPRPTLRLEGRAAGGAPLIENKSGRDLTAPMRALAPTTAADLAALDLSGFVLKKDSPTCGMARVRVYRPTGIPERDGTGLFAAALRQAMPLLPLEEEGRLREPHLREAFLTRIFAYRRARDFFAGAWTMAGLQGFQASWKMLLLLWSPAIARELGHIVGVASGATPALAEQYTARFMAAFAGPPPNRARHVNVLAHLIGHFRGRAGEDERRELRQLIDEFARGEQPLAAPLALVRHHLRRHRIAWLESQTYLEPFPRVLVAEPV
jgi:uncharacterized protein YbbK (DUF523 family)/uncharacterized protein YbgA (DUF1722 family)